LKLTRKKKYFVCDERGRFVEFQGKAFAMLQVQTCGFPFGVTQARD
jgi:hypothetical protein